MAADAPAVTATIHAAYRHYVERLGRRPAPMGIDYAQAIANGGVHVAVRESAVRGLVMLSDSNADFMLDNLAVAPAWQGHGIGRRLIGFAEDQARAHGHDRIVLYTNEQMVENIALYQGLGYVEVARRCEDGYRRVHMAKPLRP